MIAIEVSFISCLRQGLLFTTLSGVNRGVVIRVGPFITAIFGYVVTDALILAKDAQATDIATHLADRNSFTPEAT